jgi:hypothetical protein
MKKILAKLFLVGMIAGVSAQAYALVEDVCMCDCEAMGCDCTLCQTSNRVTVKKS